MPPSFLGQQYPFTYYVSLLCKMTINRINCKTQQSTDGQMQFLGGIKSYLLPSSLANVYHVLEKSTEDLMVYLLEPEVMKIFQ